MTTETLHVNGNSGSANWVTYDYSNIQSTEDPTTPSSSPYIKCDQNDDNESQAYTTPDIDSGSGTTYTVTQVVLHLFGGTYDDFDSYPISNSTLTVNASIAGSSLGSSTFSLPSGSGGNLGSWFTKTWSSLSISTTGAASNPIITLTSPTMGKNDEMRIRAMYLVVTYSVSGGDAVNGGSSSANSALLVTKGLGRMECYPDGLAEFFPETRKRRRRRMTPSWTSPLQISPVTSAHFVRPTAGIFSGVSGIAMAGIQDSSPVAQETQMAKESFPLTQRRKTSLETSLSGRLVARQKFR